MSMNSFHARFARPPVKAPARTVVRRSGQRADQLLVDQGLAPSRTAAQRMIGAGRVSWDEGVIVKAAQELPPDARLAVADSDEDRYVSRGGLKLSGALARTGIEVRGRVCLDVGQSTGGFTDCLLQAGAARVVGVDVGHGQLHARLRSDPRVTCLEGVNGRALDEADLPERRFDLIVADLSFISLALVLPQLPARLNDDGCMILLVKPQFEVGAENIGRGGIVRDPSLYPQVEGRLRQAAQAAGLRVLDYFASPITGGDGNREFFLWTRHEQA